MGVVELIALPVLMGLSIDYSLHIDHAYRAAAAADGAAAPAALFRRASTAVGPAVFAAACTTFACTFVLAFAQLIPFARLGALASGRRRGASRGDGREPPERASRRASTPARLTPISHSADGSAASDRRPRDRVRSPQVPEHGARGGRRAAGAPRDPAPRAGAQGRAAVRSLPDARPAPPRRADGRRGSRGPRSGPRAPVRGRGGEARRRRPPLESGPLACPPFESPAPFARLSSQPGGDEIMISMNKGLTWTRSVARCLAIS